MDDQCAGRMDASTSSARMNANSVDKPSCSFLTLHHQDCGIVDGAFEEIPLNGKVLLKEHISFVSSPVALDHGVRKRRFGHMWMLFWLCFYCTMQGMLVSGLVPSVLSTVEKRFNFCSASLGRIMQSYDIAYAVFCTPLAYFGGRHSKPLYLGIGLMIMASGSFLFSVPHIITDSSFAFESERAEVSHCNVTRIVGDDHALAPMFLGHDTSDGLCNELTCSGDTSALPDLVNEDSLNSNNGLGSNSRYERIFSLAHFLNGVGSAPLFTLGVSYIDDNVQPALSSFYIGVFYTCLILGPSAGFFLSSILLQIHTDFLFTTGNELTYVRAAVAAVNHWLQGCLVFSLEQYSEEDPDWIGAWWFGFQVTAVLCLVAVVPILNLPPSPKRRVQRSPEQRTSCVAYRSKSEIGESMECSANESLTEQVVVSAPDAFDSGMGGRNADGTKRKRPEQCDFLKRVWNDVKDIPIALYRLLSNPCYMCITLAAAFAGLLVSGFSGFTAKYLEKQFSVPSSKANLIIGSIMVPFAALGTLCSGYVVKRFRLSRSLTLKLCVAMELCSLILSPMFLLYCEPAKYFNDADNDHHDTQEMPLNIDRIRMDGIIFQCNGHCTCKISEFHPVCGTINGSQISFISPCFAGCPEPFERAKRLYENCTCVHNGVVTAGICEPRCSSLILFLLLFAPMCFFTFSIGVPALSVVLRSVDYNERAFALGIQGILIRCIGTIPSPAVFSWLFDVACIVNAASGDKSLLSDKSQGRCLIHSTKLLADLFLSFAVLGQFLTGALFTLAVLYDRRASNRPSEPLPTSADRMAYTDVSLSGGEMARELGTSDVVSSSRSMIHVN